MRFHARPTGTSIATLIASGLFIAALPGCGSDNDSPSSPAVTNVGLATVSTRAMMVSGNDVVVEATLPSGTSKTAVSFLLNGADVSDRMVLDETTMKVRGLVTGLGSGTNVLTAMVAGQQVGKLELKNFPASGPIFSGKRQSPWICETKDSGLGAPPASGPCVSAVQYNWFYRTTAGKFEPLASLAAPYPADLAKTVTTEGKTVNYIVRVESGTINESIYRIAVLDDPANPIREPWSKSGKRPGDGWNGKLSYPFLGGAGPGFTSGSNLVTSALQDVPLSLGFAVAFGTRNAWGTGFDDVTSAETVMMIKERFIEQYGLPKFTIGSGESGGSIQVHYIAQNYPGLLDAIAPSASFSDMASLVMSVFDCGPLNNYFNNLSANPAAWTGARRSAVDGEAVAQAGPAPGKTVCQNNWLGFVPAIYSTNPITFSPAVPASLRYDPITNSGGARGTYWDGNVNSFGRDERTGFARSPYDNVGVQYGLQAVNSGTITPEEFVDLNEKIGGIDIDGQLTTKRTSGDPVAARRAYASGRLVTSFENLTLPIVDYRTYSDNLGDIHTRERTMIFLERLKKANGTTANQVTWTTTYDANAPAFEKMALLGLNDWLEKIAADTSQTAYAAKVINNKPAALKDACWINGARTEEAPTWDAGTVCNRAMPIHQNMRLVAGAPRTDDVLICKLKPVDFASYAVTFTAAQQARLKATFPRGVCDWNAAGEGQVPLSGTWIDFSAGPFGPANIYN